MRSTILLTVSFGLSLISSGKPISLYDYGWAEAETGEERFWVMYNAHVDAVKKNCAISYSGFRNIEIEIPANAKTIPLTEKTNFRNLSLTVKNTKKRDFSTQNGKPTGFPFFGRNDNAETMDYPIIRAISAGRSDSLRMTPSEDSTSPKP